MARPQKALVVDDLPVNRLILGTILSKLGFEVLEAENGLQCIDVYSQERTHLVCVFLDLQMPVADGWTATKGIRELESQAQGAEYLRVPVVVCTASCLDDLVEDGQTVAQRALSLGADGAVRKPLTPYAVQRILDQYAPRWRSCQADCSDSNLTTTTSSPPSSACSGCSSAHRPAPHPTAPSSLQQHPHPNRLQQHLHRSLHHHQDHHHHQLDRHHDVQQQYPYQYQHQHHEHRPQPVRPSQHCHLEALQHRQHQGGSWAASLPTSTSSTAAATAAPSPQPLPLTPLPR
ncbi:hypothetical protein Agub_g9703 [Astrephomene gubernaculifera]|uniref:Response regulatory domain-containing protein n=1 Tax=Astrephomene gubernaculifera TaxID=47775 RepID=A0AAD3DU50_9CHLO|nr:hypothetical protein Agub_g9703 [Astrephomene gubernaculifera]